MPTATGLRPVLRFCGLAAGAGSLPPSLAATSVLTCAAGGSLESVDHGRRSSAPLEPATSRPAAPWRRLPIGMSFMPLLYAVSGQRASSGRAAVKAPCSREPLLLWAAAGLCKSASDRPKWTEKWWQIWELDHAKSVPPGGRCSTLRCIVAAAAASPLPRLVPAGLRILRSPTGVSERKHAAACSLPCARRRRPALLGGLAPLPRHRACSARAGRQQRTASRPSRRPGGKRHGGAGTVSDGAARPCSAQRADPLPAAPLRSSAGKQGRRAVQQCA